MADLVQPEQISPLFAGYQNDLYEYQKAAGLPDQRPDQVIRHARPAADQG